MSDVRMSSLGENYRAVVFGASGGIGRAVVEALSADPRCGAVYAGARSGIDVTAKSIQFRFDLRDEASIAAAAQQMGAVGPLDLVLVATGVLHGESLKPEKTFRALDPGAMAAAFEINTIGPALVAKHVLPLLTRERKAIFAALSARVGSIADNRLGGWHAYRASKAALNMLIRNFSIELSARSKHAVCVALHPGTVDTDLSKPFQTGVAQERLFSPQRSAAEMLRVLDAAGVDRNGALIAWDGQTIPF